MKRATLGLALAAVAAMLLTSCTSGSQARQRASDVHTGASPSPSPSILASLLPSASPSPKPKPTTKPKAKSKPKAATASATAASLDIPGAGTLEIPAWPNQKGMRYHGPDGSQGSTGTTSVALTFDDGPGPYTSQILDVLDKYHIKATFCIIGRQVHAYASVVAREIADGMTICNHSWDHNEQIAKHPAPYIAANLQKMINAIQKVKPGATVAYYRNPGGNFTPGTVRVAALLGMRSLYWSVDTKDWTRPGTAAIEKAVLGDTHRDSVVLMHDGGGDRSETVAALKAVLPTLIKKYHLIALPTARTVAVNPGGPTTAPSAPPSSAPPANGDVPADVPDTVAGSRRP